MSDYIEYNGQKIKPRIFDYDTPEGWNKFIDATYGSITDESFVRPQDFDYDTPDGWNKFIDATYGSITDETFMAPSDWHTTK